MKSLIEQKIALDAAAERAVMARQWAVALDHMAASARIAFQMADLTADRVSAAWAREGDDLVRLAAAIRQRQERGNRPLAEANGNADGNPGGKDLKATGHAERQSFLVMERPDKKLRDVVGMEPLKQTLRELIIDPLQHPDVAKRFGLKAGGGVLMYGPPGTGKTHIAQALAGELGCPFFNVDPARLKDKYIGESEKNMKAIFDEARQHERAIVFIDEADEILKVGQDEKIGLRQQFLRESAGFEQSKNALLLLAATNRPWDLDPAAIRPGRLGVHIYVGLPDYEARVAMVELFLRDAVVGDTLNCEHVARATDGYSGSEIEHLILAAKRSAQSRQIRDGQPQQVDLVDIEHALAVVRPINTPSDLARFEAWGKAAQS